MDTKINIYIVSVFLKLHNLLIIFDSNIIAQRFVNTEKLTFKIDTLQT